jgi:hypothetical protein
MIWPPYEWPATMVGPFWRPSTWLGWAFVICAFVRIAGGADWFPNMCYTVWEPVY